MVGKLAKDRFTILLTTSACGEKLQHLVIWKSYMPRCFRSQLPPGVKWYANKKAWMTAKIFKEYLTNLDEKMRSPNRHILLFLDNATVHANNHNYTNLTLKFSPHNTTAGTQSLDAGIKFNVENISWSS